MIEIQPEIEGEDGWTDWIHPLPGYLLQCCDCGLIHRMEFKIVPRFDAEGLNPGEDDEHVIVFQASRFARHRQSAIAELCEGLAAVLDTSGARGTYHSLRYSEAVERAEALLAKHSPDAPGNAGTRATESGDGDEA